LFQHQEDDETKQEEYLMSEDAQFAKLENSFKEVGYWLCVNLSENVSKYIQICINKQNVQNNFKNNLVLKIKKIISRKSHTRFRLVYRNR